MLLSAACPPGVIRFRFPDKTIARLQAVKWWDLPLPLMSGLPFDKIDQCLDRLEEIRADHDHDAAATSVQSRS